VRITDNMHALDVFLASFATTRRSMALAPVPVPDGVTVHQLPFPDIGDLGRTDFSTSGKLLEDAYTLTTRFLAAADAPSRSLAA